MEELQLEQQLLRKKRQGHKERVRQYIWDYKACNPCRGCGETDIEKLTFHHRRPEEKSFELARATSCSWRQILEEIEKCDMLCYSCHKKLEYHVRHSKSKRIISYQLLKEG